MLGWSGEHVIDAASSLDETVAQILADLGWEGRRPAATDIA
ncbi:MAG: hypothetical protein ACR2F6_09060 [Mycobacteriales bacterium]